MQSKPTRISILKALCVVLTAGYDFSTNSTTLFLIHTIATQTLLDCKQLAPIPELIDRYGG